jgi:hypothetical protein
MAGQAEVILGFWAVGTVACLGWGFFIRRRHPGLAWACVAIGFLQLALMLLPALQKGKSHGPADRTAHSIGPNQWLQATPNGSSLLVGSQWLGGPDPGRWRSAHTMRAIYSFLLLATCQLLASSFSQYVYSCVWDYRIVLGQPALVQPQNGALSPSALGTLSTLFREEIQMHGWPGSTQYRFHRDGQAILIWDEPKQADWFIAGPTAEALECALVAAWNLDDVGNSLYDCSELGREVLERIRSTA